MNSTAPFPPVVSYASPTRAVHSALLLTRAERDGAPPRLPTAEARAVSARELGEVLGGLPAEIEALAGQLAAAEAEHADARDAARAALLAVEPELEATVERYNDASPRARPAELAELGGSSLNVTARAPASWRFSGRSPTSRSRSPSPSRRRGPRSLARPPRPRLRCPSRWRYLTKGEQLPGLGFCGACILAVEPAAGPNSPRGESASFSWRLSHRTLFSCRDFATPLGGLGSSLR